MMEAMKQAFEVVAMAKVSTSAFEARNLGFLSTGDDITMNRERVLTDAKERAQELVHEGYRAPVPRSDIPAPGESILATLKLGVHIMHEGEFITDHEVKIGNKVAEVLCGGALNPGTLVSEQYSARPGTRGLQVALRREKDAGAHPVHAEDGEDAEELTVV
jgi:3-hydroxyacyl-CoA dehydrogenase